MNDKPAFLYSIARGVFVIMEGTIYKPAFSKINRVSFCTKRKRYMCASEPAVVQNEVLWLTERDDNKARTLFLNHETKRIEDIENMKKAHKAKIYALIECEVAKER